MKTRPEHQFKVTEISCAIPRLLARECSHQQREELRPSVANEQKAQESTRASVFFERDSGADRWVQKMLNAKK